MDTGTNIADINVTSSHSLEALVGGIDYAGVDWSEELHQTLSIGHYGHLGEVDLGGAE